jgi:hypothetical protein
MTGHPQVNFWFADVRLAASIACDLIRGLRNFAKTVTGRKLLHVVSQTLSNRAAIGDFRS